MRLQTPTDCLSTPTSVADHRTRTAALQRYSTYAGEWTRRMDSHKASLHSCLFLILSLPHPPISSSYRLQIHPPQCGFPPMQTPFGHPIPLMPSLFSRLRTEIFHRIFRQILPRFQPKFCPRRDGRSCQEGQESRKEMARARTLSGVKARAPGAVPKALSTTLQFCTPLVNSLSSWPEQQADITRKLKRTQKSLSLSYRACDGRRGYH